MWRASAEAKASPHTYNMCYKEPRHYKHSVYRPHRTPPPSDGETPIQNGHISDTSRDDTETMQNRYINRFGMLQLDQLFWSNDNGLIVKPHPDKPTAESHATGCGTLPRPVREGTIQQWTRSTRRPQPATLTEGER